MKIKEFMIEDVISVKEEMTIKELLEILVSNKIGGVPVASDDHTLLGIISDGDVIRYLQPQGRTVYDMFTLILVNEKEDLAHRLKYSMTRQVKEIMRAKKIQSVKPEDNIEKALDIFSKYHIKKIPVVDNSNHIVGVVSRGDVIQYITSHLIDESEV
ncbi:CBS domain-containing protein [Virgibacillus ainsalahensis]